MADGNGTGMCERELFGGAMACCLPINCIDASKIREVPDNQEVFCHKETDQSIIIDILEYQGHAVGGEAARYHFNDIAEANEALTSSQVNSIESINREQLSMSQCHEAWYLNGIQEVSKYNEQADNIVQVYLSLFRLPQFGTDIVVTMNNPTQLSTESSSSSQQKPCNSSHVWTSSTFQNIICTLRINDTSLFG